MNPATIDFSHPFPFDKLHFIITWGEKNNKAVWQHTDNCDFTKNMFCKYRFCSQRMKRHLSIWRIFLTILEDMCLLTCTRHWIFNIKKLVCRGSKVVKVTCVTADVLIGLKVKTVYPVPPCVFLSMTQEALSSRCREFFLTMSLIVECEDACAPKGNRSGECGTGGC